MRVGKGFWKLAAGLALFATLCAGLLPNGQLPRIAGRCGQALCYCTPEPVSESAMCGGSRARFQVVRVLSLGESICSGLAPAAGAFQVVVSNAILRPTLKIRHNTYELVELSITHRHFAVKQYVADIHAPPPRV